MITCSTGWGRAASAPPRLLLSLALFSNACMRRCQFVFWVQPADRKLTCRMCEAACGSNSGFLHLLHPTQVRVQGAHVSCNVSSSSLFGLNNSVVQTFGSMTDRRPHQGRTCHLMSLRLKNCLHCWRLRCITLLTLVLLYMERGTIKHQQCRRFFSRQLMVPSGIAMTLPSEDMGIVHSLRTPLLSF